MYGDLFAKPISVADEIQGRIVFLISTDLPAQEYLEQFRQATSLKGAFFRPVPKSLLTKEWVKKEILAKIIRYGDLQKWVAYLELFSEQIAVVSNSVCAEIGSLELHDLSILDSLRLKADSEHLGDYLSWLFSEALASRIRQSAPLAEATHIVDQIGGTPFQGMLMPKPVLFGLYSDIVFSPPRNEAGNQKVHFGDVFSATLSLSLNKASETAENTASEVTGKGEAIGSTIEPTNDLNDGSKSDEEKDKLSVSAPSGSPISPISASKDIALDRSTDLLLVISPACDLQRCNSEYEVLCVRGRVVNRVSNLADLHSPQAVYGKDDEVFKHLLRQQTGTVISYHVVEWSPKKITTLPIATLTTSAKYLKQARLNELFGQEIKEEALRQISRVGVPVDPSYSSALSAVVHIKKAKKNYLHREAPDDEFVSGIFISANENNEAVIMLSEEFLTFLEKIPEEFNNEGLTLDPKIALAFKTLREEGAKGVKLTASRLYEFDGGFKIRLLEEFQKSLPLQGNEIIFFPRGRSSEAPCPVPLQPVVNEPAG